MSKISNNKQYRREDIFADFLKIQFPPYKKKSRRHDTNLENLKTVINYFTHLKRNNELNDKEFSAYLTRACAIFVENELTATFNEVFFNPLRDLKGILGMVENE